MKTGDYRLILSLETLKDLDYTSTMDGAAHKVNHIDINPDGTRFMFLHRWIGPQGRFMRLITAVPDDSDLYILNGDVMTSHCCWLDEEYILSYCEYNGKKGYFKFRDRSNDIIVFSDKMPKKDGHPSISPDKKWLVTDTYPDLSRMSFLYLYDMQKDRVMKLGEFFQPLRYHGEKRTDLHPKWGFGGDRVFFESSHTGVRQLYCMFIS